MLDYGKEQSKELLEVVELEAKRRQINEKIKPKNERIDYLARVIDSGREIQDVECYWSHHWDNGDKDLIRRDTFEVVVTEKIKDWERQQHLKLADKEAA